MADGTLAWHRFWSPPNGSATLDLDGYLVDPRGEYAAFIHNDAVAADAFADTPCVVLLGEPGSGKSFEMRRNFGQLPDDETRIFRNLRDYDSTSALRDDLFLCAAFRRWESGAGTLTLSLDSLDEGLLQINVLSSWLVSQLKRVDTSRLKLRIACRTAQWPQSLENDLMEIWGKKDVRVYRLAPLTRSDVRLAAEAKGVDPFAFLAEVARQEASPLANRPATLRFLLSAFARDESLPQSRRELYARGCLYLCEDDEERVISRRAGTLLPIERLAVARRIAAATIFGNRSGIWRGPEEEKPTADVTCRELTGASEPVLRQQRLTVTERELNEALGTGLFSGRHDTALMWTHQSYAEFLAAEWVIENDLLPAQIQALIEHPEDPDRCFVPQLQETIAWVAGMHSGVRALVLSREPELLLDTDADKLTHDDRRALASALLNAEQRGERKWPSVWALRHLDRLAHPTLADQLRSFILDRALSEDVRELALEIATDAKVGALECECTDLALSKSEPLTLRVEAARLVAAVGSEPTRARLIPLAVDPQPEDEDDDLKGTALRTVWRLIAPAQLFEVLRRFRCR